MTTEQFDEWHAYYMVEPWGDEWEIGGTIAAEVHNVVNQAVGADSRRLPKQYKPKYLTKKQREARKLAEQAQLEYAEHVDRQRYGGV